jgi:hypothetical protein
MTLFPREEEESMKYVCFGYMDEKSWESKTEKEQHAFFDACFAYDDYLRKNGHFADGMGLQSQRDSATLRHRDGKVTVTDGPYAETKEQLGGILVLEATDLNHAIELIRNHPGVKAGPWEIRPMADLSEAVRESETRRGTPAREVHA